jgi:hypothetical protein
MSESNLLTCRERIARVLQRRLRWELLSHPKSALARLGADREHVYIRQAEAESAQRVPRLQGLGGSAQERKVSRSAVDIMQRRCEN